jgi:XRE family transcriptional regulator, regulator of sulfur utilization
MKSAVHVALGHAMRAARKEQGYSQEKLAARMGLDGSYYGSIERGEYKASIAMIDRIACGLDMKLSELLARARL